MKCILQVNSIFTSAPHKSVQRNGCTNLVEPFFTCSTLGQNFQGRCRGGPKEDGTGSKSSSYFPHIQSDTYSLSRAIPVNKHTPPWKSNAVLPPLTVIVMAR